MNGPEPDSGSLSQCEGNAPLGGTDSYTREDCLNIEEIERINWQDTTPEDSSKIKELEESLKQDGIKIMNNHHASAQCNSNHAADSCLPSRDASTQKSFTTLTSMQLGNKQEPVKQSHLASYKAFRLHPTPYPEQIAHGGDAPVKEYKTQNFCSTAPPIKSQSKERNHSYQDLTVTSSQSSNDKQSKKSSLQHYKEHSSFFDNVKCILMIDFFRIVPLEKIHFEDNDVLNVLKTFVPIKAAPNLLEHNMPNLFHIYAKLVHSEQHNTSNLATWFVINGKYFCNRWHYSSKNYDSSGNYVFNCAGVENKNHGGKRTRGENGGENSKDNKCLGSIWIKVDLEQREMTIGKKEDHTNEHCLRNLFKIFHDDCRHMVCKNESMEGAIEEFKKLLQDLKNHLQNEYQLNVSSPSNEEADKKDYFTYNKSVKVNGKIRKSADLQFFDRAFKIDQKSTNRCRPINQTEFRVKIMNIIEHLSTSTKANDSATPVIIQGVPPTQPIR